MPREEGDRLQLDTAGEGQSEEAHAHTHSSMCTQLPVLSVS